MLLVGMEIFCKYGGKSEGDMYIGGIGEM